MITHFPLWRQGLGLQRTISERKEHKNIKISQRMNERLKEVKRKECGRKGMWEEGGQNKKSDNTTPCELNKAHSVPNV